MTVGDSKRRRAGSRQTVRTLTAWLMPPHETPAKGSAKIVQQACANARLFRRFSRCNSLNSRQRARFFCRGPPPLLVLIRTAAVTGPYWHLYWLTCQNEAVYAV